jgi:hypothetical protein
MSGHQRKKQKGKIGNSPNKKQRTPPKSQQQKKQTTPNKKQRTTPNKKQRTPRKSPQQKKPTTSGFGLCAIEGCTNAHLDHSHTCCGQNCRHFLHTLCATTNHLYDEDNELRIFCSSSCKGDPVDDTTTANTRANKPATQKDPDQNAKSRATNPTKRKADTHEQPHTPPFASVAKKPAPQKDSDSETDPTPKQFDSGGDQDAKPRAKNDTKHKKQKMPFTSKIFDKKRSERLQNRHDPKIYENKLQEYKQKKALQQEKRKETNDRIAALKNEVQLFNQFFNSTLKIPLRNNKREDTQQTNEERINQSVTLVNDYMQRNYSEVSSDTTQMQNEADIIQKIIYEPITDTKPEHSFTIIHEDGSKEERITTEWLEDTIGKPIVHIALKTGKRIHQLGNQQSAFILPSGDTNHDVAPLSCLVKYNEKGHRQKTIKYPQGDSPHCFMNSFASALHYIGKINESRIAHSKADDFSKMGLVEQLKHLVNLVNRQMIDVFPKSKSHNWKDSTVQELLQAATNEQLMIVVPKPNDKSTSHAVTICMGLVFDSTQKYPLYSTQQTYDFISGSTGFERTYMTRSFRLKLH